MTKTFQEQIKNFPHPLFYNTSGSTTAYKLGIRHLGAAPMAKFATLSNTGYIYPKESIYLVDFENETIEIIDERVKLVKLKQS